MASSTTPVVATNRDLSQSTQPVLLWAGIVGPILFATVFLIDGVLKPGYSAVDEAISYLEVGSNGWIQQANFIIFGLLLFGFLAGYSTLMRPILGPGWLTAASVFLALSDLGWIMAGLFIPNPFGTPQDSGHALLHQIASITVFLPLAVACLILGAKLVPTRGWRAYGAYCLIYGLLQTVFPVGTIIYLFNPAIVGNTSSPGDGITNRLVLGLGPFAWYAISAIVALLHIDRSRRASGSRLAAQ